MSTNYPYVEKLRPKRELLKTTETDISEWSYVFTVSVFLIIGNRRLNFFPINGHSPNQNRKYFPQMVMFFFH